MSVSPSSRYAGAFQVIYKTFANNPVSTVTILADSEERAKAIFASQHVGETVQPIIVAVSETVIGI